MNIMKKFVLILSALCVASFFSCNNSSDSPAFIPTLTPNPNPEVEPRPEPQPQTKNSDWLFLCYFDADDGNINDDLYRNIRDIECAFAQTRKADGSPKDGYANVTALVLWDGISEDLKKQQQFIHPDGALYEIGADPSLRYVPDPENEYGAGFVQLGEGFAVGPNTKDLTSQAGDWLKKEPNMSDPATLTNFLKWAKARYDAPNVVLCLQDHGAGTYKETYTDSTAVSKTLCTDETSDGKKRQLTCKNITDALTEAGWTGDKKPKILWNDLCLQATAEILWNYKGCADYYCASPNESWMPDYYGVFANIKSGMSALDVGKVMVSAYMHRYYKNPQPSPSAGRDPRNTRASGVSMYTASFISLDSQKVNELKAKVDGLADTLWAIKKSDQVLFDSIYTSLIKQDIDSLANCKGLVYNGTYAWLNDLGWLCTDICDFSYSNSNSASALQAAKESAAALQTFLKNGDEKLIVYAWGGRRAVEDNQDGSWARITDNQMYLTGQKDFISKKQVAVVDDADCYGLTIVGSVWVNIKPEFNPILHYDDWTGFSSKWGLVIKAWGGL